MSEKICHGVMNICKKLKISVTHFYFLMSSGVFVIPRETYGQRQYYLTEVILRRALAKIEAYNMESKRRGPR